jgi:hypothetical protein
MEVTGSPPEADPPQADRAFGRPAAGRKSGTAHFSGARRAGKISRQTLSSCFPIRPHRIFRTYGKPLIPSHTNNPAIATTAAANPRQPDGSRAFETRGGGAEGDGDSIWTFPSGGHNSGFTNDLVTTRNFMPRARQKTSPAASFREVFMSLNR